MLRQFLYKILLERAIALEESDYRFYEEALSRSALSDTSELLRKLLAGELMHRMRLEEMQRTGEPGRLAGTGAGGGEESGELVEELPALHPWAHRREVLEVALRREAAARRFYRRLAGRAALKSVRDVFHALSAEESAHAEWIEKELRKVGG